MVVPPLAGVLSAYGIGVADATALREQSVESQLTREQLADVRELCASLERQTRQELREDGIPEEAISTSSRLQLRYAGTDASLTVPLSDADRMAEDFAAEHRARYGFTMDKPLVVATAVAEATGAAGPVSAHPVTPEPGGGIPELLPTRCACSPAGDGGRRLCSGGRNCARGSAWRAPPSSRNRMPPRSWTPAGRRRPIRAGTCC